MSAAISAATRGRSTAARGASPDAAACARPTDGGRWVTDLFRMALQEGGSGRAGSETILAKLSELMFVEVIRRYIETLPAETRGWLSGLRDPHVGNGAAAHSCAPGRGVDIGAACTGGRPLAHGLCRAFLRLCRRFPACSI